MAELFSALRAPQSFGLAGMMRPESRVYHEVLFDLNGIGRVSDLFSARLRRALPDELAFRAVILHGVVDGFRAFAQGSPIRMECGLDSEKIGITIGFVLDPAQAPAIEGLKDRVNLRKPRNGLERVLIDIVSYGERVYFKHQPSTGMAEICILNSINEGQVGVGARERGQFEALLMPGEVTEGPPVAEYTLLGDLDYRKLLKSSRESSDPLAPYAGEVLLHEARSSAGVMEAVRMRKLLVPEEPIATSGSYEEAEAEAIRIKGVTQKIEADDTAVRVEATEAVDADERVEFEAPLEPLEPVDEDPIRIKASPEKRAKGSKKRSFFRRLFGLSEPETSPEGHEDLLDAHAGEPLAESASVEGEALPDVIPDEHIEEIAPPPSLKEIHKSAKDLEQECEKGGLSKLADRVEKEGASIRGEVKNAKAEKWIEGLSAELVAERAKIAELSKKLLLSVRQKELEFKNRENALLQNVRTRDESIRSKTLQLMRMKDQVAKLQLAVERARSNSGNAEESAAKIKLSQTQRLLQNSRSEVEQLNLKLQEMKARFEQMSERGRQTVPSSLYNELQRKAEKLAKQVEEMKRSGQAKPAASAHTPDDDSEAA